jgi:hypothetical protein
VPAIADEPLFTLSTVKANLMMTLDNSGSMGWQFAPMNTSVEQDQALLHELQLQPAVLQPEQHLPAAGEGRRYALPDSSFNGAWRDGFTTTAGTRDLRTSSRP